MYLLKLNVNRAWLVEGVFTFHYVSIKTVIAVSAPAAEISFTFHYVSIKTQFCQFIPNPAILFTFHYVSIKTHCI